MRFRLERPSNRTPLGGKGGCLRYPLAEVALLQGKSDAMKRALLTTLGAMPGSRVLQ